MFKKRLTGENGTVSAKNTSIISEGTRFKGNIISSDSLRIDGEVEGDIDCAEKLIIGPSGKIKGNIKGGDVLVSGLVIGNIKAIEGLMLKNKSQVKGDITTRMLTVEPEAVFNGGCQMEGSLESAVVKLGKAKKENEKMPEALTK